MIQLSPHTEATAQPVSHTQELNEPLPQSKNEKSALGVFAKILAGLSGKKPAQQSLANPGSPDNGLLQADAAQKAAKSARAQTADLGEAALTLPGTEKNSRAGKIAALNKKNGEMEPALSQLTLSEQDKNIFTVDRLTRQNEEQIGENGLAVMPALVEDQGRRTVKTDQVPAPVTLNEIAGEQRQSLPANMMAAAELAEKPGDGSSKRAKSRANPAENLAQGDSAGKKVSGEDPSRQLEAKKVVLGDKEPRNKLEEARNKRRNVASELRDTRTGAGQGEFTLRDGAVHLRTGAESRFSGDGTAKEISLELRLPNQGQDSSSATTSWEAKAGQSFEDMLARELHQNFNNDIVRHASVALREGGEGTIRLALKPESLGNVKIRLEMADNKITGYIIVESEEALRAFEREISSLEKAFRDSGFDDANLEMSLAGDNRGTDQRWQETEASRFLSEQFAASRYDAAIEQLEIPLTLDVYELGSRSVNVLA